ncbi:hypothetical protein [Clostridium sp. L74]|uniref:hypothetical protein n=1 Tax=Clostridium sp. L74 TaxID=1560217 RepID=UPI00128C6B04|nr:hypothetical protein [Clostridium sp. L74]
MYISRGIIFKNKVFQDVDKNTIRILKNKNSYGIVKIFSINLKDSIEYLPKDTILKTKTHEKIVGLMEKNKKIIIIKKRRNIFKHFLLIEKLKLNIHESLFEPQKFYNISFKIIK